MYNTYSSHMNFRHCSRCHLPLSDPKSFEIGKGAICAAKDHTLFSKTVYVQPAYVQKHINDFCLDNLHFEIRSRAKNLFEKINNKLQKAVEASTVDQIMSGNIQAGSFRDEVKEIDYLLSWKCENREKGLLINIVKHLGFPAIASVLAGTASTGEAEIDFVDGNFQIKGSRVKAAYEEFKKYKDIQFPKKYANSFYSIPVKYIDNLEEWIYYFWPILDNDKIALAMLKAQKYIEDENNKPKPIIIEQIQNSINENAKTYLRFNYVGNSFQFYMKWDSRKSYRVIQELKNYIFSKDRNYDPNTRVWTVSKADKYFEGMKNILNKNAMEFKVISS